MNQAKTLSTKYGTRLTSLNLPSHGMFNRQLCSALDLLQFLLSNSTMEPRSTNKPLSNTRRRRPQTQNLPIRKPKRFTRTRERYCVCIEKEEILIACLLLSVKSSTTNSHSKTLARLKLGCSKPNEVVSGIYPKNVKNTHPVSTRISSTQVRCFANLTVVLQLLITETCEDQANRSTKG